MARTTSTTGIGVRNGSANLGGVTTQPIPLVLNPLMETVRPSNLLSEVGTTMTTGENLATNNSPLLTIPVASFTGNIGFAELSSIRTATNQAELGSESRTSPIRIFNPDLTTSRRPNDETLSVSQTNIRDGNFEPAERNGISRLRPEIIGLMNYQPIFLGNSNALNDVGTLLSVQSQARSLREQTLLGLAQNIQRSQQTQAFQELQTEFNRGLQRVNETAEFYRNTLNAVDNIKNGFDIKSISNGNFDTSNFLTLLDFFELFMGFPRATFNNFSNTKILMQLLFDMKSISEGYSMNLLNLSDPDRQRGGDYAESPIAIDQSYKNRNGFSFSYDTIRSYSNPVNASDNAFFTRFNSSLPQSVDDRIKILINMFSKELRVSKAISNPSVINKLRQRFNANITDGSPFDNIFGGIGRSIFDIPTGENSIASLLTINNTNQTSVLPFETKYIDVNNVGKTYIPGSVFLAESVVNVSNANGFNLEPLSTYVGKFSDVTSNASDLIATIFEYGDWSSSLCPIEILKQMLHGISHGLTFLMSSTQRAGLQISTADAATVAIFKLSTTDPELKSMLFQYVLLTLLSSTRSRFFADGVSEDFLNDIRYFDAVPLDDPNSAPDLRSQNALQPYINGLGAAIQRKVVALVNRQNLETPRPILPRDRGGVLSNGLMQVGFDVDITYGISAALNQSNFIRNLISFFVGIETEMGNDINNIKDNLRRTRFNSLSVSTLVLMCFETYSCLISRYAKVEFQTSSYGQNFPDMIVDTDFNALMRALLEEVIAEPVAPLPLIPSGPSNNRANYDQAYDPLRAITQNAGQNRRNLSIRQVYDQTSQVASETGQTSTDVHQGIIEHESIIGGQRATAGSRNTSAAQIARRMISHHSNPQDLIDAYEVERSLDSIANKLSQEDYAIACGMHILLVIKDRLRNALNVATTFFNNETLSSFIQTNNTHISDVARNLTPTQIRLLLKQRDAYIKQQTINSQVVQFIPTTATDENSKNLVWSLLNKSQFRETEEAELRYRLITVGIPSGFSRNLADRLVGNNITAANFQRNKEFDLIYVKIYKRSLEFPQLIFKPQKFLFDLSLFGNGYNDLNIGPVENFDNVLQRISLLDYQNLTNPREVTLTQMMLNDLYSVIPDARERSRLFENHVVSDILSLYIQMLSSIKLDEATFVDMGSLTWQTLMGQTTSNLSERFAEVVRRFLIANRATEMQQNSSLRALPDLSISDMLISPEVDSTTKDTLRLLTFGNLAFKPEQALGMMLTPKLFERVFTIPLNVDLFEIDFERTTATQSGREFFNSNFLQRKLDTSTPPNVYKLRPRTNREVVFEDFFTTIELVE